jgi:molybdenum cofactor synthesis domain-containing protein
VPAFAAILTVGDELLCGDVSNTNARWLARELEALGLLVRIIGTVGDDRESIALFVRWGSRETDAVVVTGGLGATPDDVTRDGVADAFGVPRQVVPKLAAELEAAGGHAAALAHEWANLPEGSRVLARIAGGAPAFAIANVYVLAGAPAEMRASFRAIRAELMTGTPRETWRRRYVVTEDQILRTLDYLDRSHPHVVVGSYPNYGPRGPEVEVVLRGSERDLVAAAAVDLESAFAAEGVEPASPTPPSPTTTASRA